MLNKCLARRTPFVPLLLTAFLVAAAPRASAQQWAAQGVVIPYHDATLSVTVSGTVAKVLEKEGDTVTKGQAIIQLRDNLQSLAVKRTRLIWQDHAALDEAKQRFTMLSEQLTHTRDLYERTHSVSEDTLQKDELQVELAKLEIERLTNSQKQAEVDYEMAEAQLKQRTIDAPFDGVIAKISVEVGDVCSPGQAVVRLVDIAKCRLVVHMDAATSRSLSKGMPVVVVVGGFGPQRVFQATIDYVAPVVDPSSGLREVKAVFDNPDERVLPGLTATLEP